MLLCATCVFAFSSCSKDDGSEDDIATPTLDQTSLTLYAGETATLTYSGGECTWSSDNPLIANVDSGVVTANYVGETIIRANDVSCMVTVKPLYTKYREPHLGWGDDVSTVQSSMNDYTLVSTSPLMMYLINDHSLYGYEFEDNKLTVSLIATVSLSEAAYLTKFVSERYIPIPNDDGITAYYTPDEKTFVLIESGSSVTCVIYIPIPTSSSRSVKEITDLKEFNMSQEMKQMINDFIKKQ